MWQLIRENIYIHRKPKVQHEDEVMVCHCELPPDGGPACGPDCLNRVLNMECVPVSPTHNCLPCRCIFRIDMCNFQLYSLHILLLWPSTGCLSC